MNIVHVIELASAGTLFVARGISDHLAGEAHEIRFASSRRSETADIPPSFPPKVQLRQSHMKGRTANVFAG
ncbi:hypothetical protein E2553_09395 [Paraburkholderia dipogonis]|uniref:Uncharacterized protein n=1 Tax=Paraburkholderia dipogonis TaxID=1211383 RepID=A0A4Y8N663_9BURK|nr:hypothetical protein [Paraburkholderia dipogonis]TFE45205.1 hypothetical protein E2553_09395 [Paraburkholderia dipogonis]